MLKLMTSSFEKQKELVRTTERGGGTTHQTTLTGTICGTTVYVRLWQLRTSDSSDTNPDVETHDRYFSSGSLAEL